ncbi:metallopeptidase [Patescibacteria group bacterium]|nr:metallopeptidase [Patescibacteria group bacterium]
MDWQLAPDVKRRLDRILDSQIFGHVDGSKITAMRGHGSSSRAIARIWSLPRPWQMVLGIKPQYIIEVIAERFDKMSEEDKDKTLIHELMHIPKTFSGALVPHKRGFNKKVNDHYSTWRKFGR